MAVGKIKIILGLAAATLFVLFIWQASASEVANVELQDDLQDLASQAGTSVGLVAPRSDDDLREAVLRKAQGLGIQLDPAEVTVQRTETAEAPIIHLSVQYDVPVCVGVCLFSLHFHPASKTA